MVLGEFEFDNLYDQTDSSSTITLVFTMLLLIGKVTKYRAVSGIFQILIPHPLSTQRVCPRGLQFYTFLGISIGIKRRLIDIAKKITFYFLQNV
jgi:hypothetical protein